jgi:RsiW-degrading membrane proteinase PrsW (M82 family)
LAFGIITLIATFALFWTFRRAHGPTNWSVFLRAFLIGGGIVLAIRLFNSMIWPSVKKAIKGSLFKRSGTEG